MERQFNLILTNRWKSTALVAGSIVGLELLVAGVFRAASSHYSLVAGGVAIALLFGWIFWFVPHMALRLCAIRAVAVIDAQGLTVRYDHTGQEVCLAFDAMASYSFSFHQDLTIRPRAGRPLRLHLNYNVHPQGQEPLVELHHKLQQAVADYQQQHPDQPPIRYLGFFARPAATVWLLLLGAVVGGLGWRAMQPWPGEAEWAGFLIAGLVGIVYAFAWLKLRKPLA